MKAMEKSAGERPDPKRPAPQRKQDWECEDDFERIIAILQQWHDWADWFWDTLPYRSKDEMRKHLDQLQAEMVGLQTDVLDLAYFCGGRDAASENRRGDGGGTAGGDG